MGGPGENVTTFIVWQDITGIAGLWIPMINAIADKDLQVDEDSSTYYPSIYVFICNNHPLTNPAAHQANALCKEYPCFKY